MKYCKVIILSVVFFIFLPSFIYGEEVLLLQKEVFENEPLDIIVLPKQQAQVLFLPKKKGEWSINIFHETKLLRDICGEVFYAISKKEQTDTFEIFRSEEVCHGEFSIKDVMVESDNKDCALLIMITQRSDIMMNVRIEVSLQK